MKKLLILGLSALLSLNGCSLKSNLSGSEAMQKTYKELAEIMEKYGIQGITDQMIEDLEQDYKAMPPEVELNKAAMLLTVLGQGDFDYENMTWTPYANGVYTFDDNMDNSLFIEQMNRLHIPVWSYPFSLKMKKKSK